PVGHLFPEPEGSGGRDYVESNYVGDPELLGNIVNRKIAYSVAIKDEKVAKLVKDGIDYVRHESTVGLRWLKPNNYCLHSYYHPRTTSRTFNSPSFSPLCAPPLYEAGPVWLCIRSEEHTSELQSRFDL